MFLTKVYLFRLFVCIFKKLINVMVLHKFMVYVCQDLKIEL